MASVRVDDIINDILIGNEPVECIYAHLVAHESAFNLSKILDACIFKCQVYHEHDELDDEFYNIAELSLLLLYDRISTQFTPQQILIALSVDSMRLRYFAWLVQGMQLRNEPNMVSTSFLIKTILCDRNYADSFNPEFIAERYHDIIGVSTLCEFRMPDGVIHWVTIKQLIHYYFDMNLLQQISETRDLYKKIIALLRALDSHSR